MNRCLTDLLDWVYNHWPGELEVTYVNKIVFREHLGNSKQHLKFVISESCPLVEDCDDPEHRASARVSILADVWPQPSTTKTPLWEGNFGPPNMQQHKGWRSDLYDLDFKFSPLVRLNEKEIKSVQRNAQEVVRSIMAMPVEPSTDSSRLALHHSRTSGSKTLQWWVRRSPGILQANYDSISLPRNLYNPIDDDSGDMKVDSPVSSADSPKSSTEAFDLHDQDQKFGKQPLINVDLPDPHYDLVRLQRGYPELIETRDLAGDRCECGCRSIGQSITLKALEDDGCLRVLGVFSTLVLIGHGLADALELRDLSNLKSKGGARNICEATVIILSQIASKGEIRWRHWFKLAESAATGMEHDIVDRIRPRVAGTDNDFGSEHAAWICGSMTVVPSWFNIAGRQELHHFWGSNILTGKPASLTADRAVSGSVINRSCGVLCSR